MIFVFIDFWELCIRNFILRSSGQKPNKIRARYIAYLVCKCNNKEAVFICTYKYKNVEEVDQDRLGWEGECNDEKGEGEGILIVGCHSN